MTGERETVRYTIDQPAPAAVPIPSTSRHHIVVTLRTSRIRDEQSGVLGHGGGPCSSQDLGKTSHWGPLSVAERRFHVIIAWKTAKTARRFSMAVFVSESSGRSSASRWRLLIGFV